jgi:hypothetical protein
MVSATRALRVGCAVTAALVGIVGCSHTTRASAPETTTVPVDFRAKYLALVGPVNGAMDALDRIGLAKVVPADLLVRIIRTTSTFDTAILGLDWAGASTRSDVRTLANAEVTLSSDLSVVNAQSALTLAVYLRRIVHDEHAATTAAKVVRADLGLPAPKSSV